MSPARKTTGQNDQKGAESSPVDLGPAPWDDDYVAPRKSGKPEKAKRKGPDSIRFPQEVKEFFRSDEPGWQRRINEALLKIARGE